MGRFTELRKIIQSQLKTAHQRVYFMDAPDDARYPYLVYDLPNSVDDGSLENFVLEVDGWDDSADTNVLEKLMDDMDNSLHRKTMVVGNLSVTFYRDNRLTLTDDDKRISRRQYIYQARVYQTGGQ